MISMFVCTAMFSSCESFLDIDEYIYDRTTIDSVFSDKVKLFEYINGIVTDLPNEGDLFMINVDTPAAGADDDWFAGATYDTYSSPGLYLLLDYVTPEEYAFSGYWAKMYRGIRKANLALGRIDECKTLTDIERRDYLGRLHFMRAYFYYSLLRFYGPIPILPNEAFNTDEDVENVKFERDTWDDCAAYIYQNMELAADFLPSTRERATEFIPTKGAALSIMARLKLYQASPWYNGNTRYANWKRSDGRHFISQQANADLWGEAAVYFEKVMNLNVYKLNTVPENPRTRPLPSNIPTDAFPDGAGGIDPYLSYKQIFDGTMSSSQIDELIYYRPSPNDNFGIASPNQLGGRNFFNVTLQHVEEYRFEDGRQYSEGTNAERSWESNGAGISFGGNYVIGPNVAVRDAYREPRFYASIGYNHCIWPGNSYTGQSNYNNYEVTYYYDGSATAMDGEGQYNHTGYTSRKFMHQDDVAHWSAPLKKTKVIPIIRYAETLLGFAEAMSEMESDYTYTENGQQKTLARDPARIQASFNQIRFRAGLPGITLAEAADRNKMRELIRQERRVEFAFEAHRYYDLRRWGIAQDYIASRPMGLNVQARTSERERFYTPTILDRDRIHRRVFTQKMYFYVIPKNVIEKNGKIVQNPGWR